MWKTVKGWALERFAEQLAVVPPLLPAHDQVQGPVPETDEAAPTEQRFVVGAAVSV
jgi:hypothetical protein